MMSMTGKRRRASAKGAIVMAATIAASGSAFAQQIVVQGNSRIDPETVRSYVVGVSPERAGAT